MNALKKRIEKLEGKLPMLPCPNPRHQSLSIFFYGVSREQDAENDALKAEIAACKRCSGRGYRDTGMNILFQRFVDFKPRDPVPDKPEAEDRLPPMEGSPINFNFGISDTFSYTDGTKLTKQEEPQSTRRRMLLEKLGIDLDD